MFEQARTGFYLRVLQEGAVQAGDALQRVSFDPHLVTVAFAVQVRQQAHPTRKDLARVLAVPALSTSWKEELQEKAVCT